MTRLQLARLCATTPLTVFACYSLTLGVVGLLVNLAGLYLQLRYRDDVT